MNNNYEKNREQWVDFVRITAIFLVVVLHSASPWLYRYGQTSNFNWQVGNVIDSITRVSVPLFFMTTGYLLLNKPVSLKDYFNKRIKRIVIPWLAWSVIYLVYKSLRFDLPITIWEGILEFINDDVYFHFWFLYDLFGLYLFIPVISWFTETDSQKRSIYFLIAWIITASIIPFFVIVGKYALKIEINPANGLSMFGGYSGYLIAGALIGKGKSTKPQLMLLIGALILGTILTIVGTTLGSYQLKRFIGYFYEYNSPNVVLASFAAFTLLKRIGMHISQNKNIFFSLEKIGYATLGIYLIHPIIINAINDGYLGSGLAEISKNSALFIPIMGTITFFLSYVVVALITYIPVVRRIV